MSRLKTDQYLDFRSSQGMPQTVTLEFPVETTFNTAYLLSTPILQPYVNTASIFSGVSRPSYL